MSVINHLLTSISDHGNALLSKLTYGFGYLSVGTGATLGIVNDTAKVLSEPSLWGLQDYAAVVAMVGGCTIVIKNSVDVYFKIKNKGRD